MKTIPLISALILVWPALAATEAHADMVLKDTVCAPVAAPGFDASPQAIAFARKTPNLAWTRCAWRQGLLDQYEARAAPVLDGPLCVYHTTIFPLDDGPGPLFTGTGMDLPQGGSCPPPTRWELASHVTVFSVQDGLSTGSVWKIMAFMRKIGRTEFKRIERPHNRLFGLWQTYQVSTPSVRSKDPFTSEEFTIQSLFGVLFISARGFSIA